MGMGIGSGNRERIPADLYTASQADTSSTGRVQTFPPDCSMERIFSKTRSTKK